MSSKLRVDGEPGFVLHGYPFKETSSIIEVLSRNFGRVALVARGARRPRSALRGVLVAFQPLELGWFGQAELRTLATAEWRGGQPLLSGQALLCGYYLNELLLKLLARDDAHPVLFDCYRDALAALSAGGPTQPVLRHFEKSLLRELGYGLTLDRSAESGEPIDPAMRYVYIIERGAFPAHSATDDGLAMSGQVLLAMAADDWSQPDTLTQGKLLMRRLIQHYLGGQTLQSRRVFVDLQEP